jgi:hypothetical protein
VAIEFIRSSHAPSLGLSLVGSDDLWQWRKELGFTETVTPLGRGLERVLLQVPSSQPARFWRLQPDGALSQ